MFDDHLPRALASLTTTIGLFGGTHVPLQHNFPKRDGIVHDLKLWLRGMWRPWGPNGLVLDMVPMWRAYFRRAFHSWHPGNRTTAC